MTRRASQPHNKGPHIGAFDSRIDTSDFDALDETGLGFWIILGCALLAIALAMAVVLPEVRHEPVAKISHT